MPDGRKIIRISSAIFEALDEDRTTAFGVKKKWDTEIAELLQIKRDFAGVMDALKKLLTAINEKGVPM